MLSAKNISYRIDGKQILENVTADFKPGQFNIILGPNGSGKSTFLRIFSGDLKATEGTIVYDERSIDRLDIAALAKQRAVMSQAPELNFPLSVEEVLMMGRYPHFDFQPAQKDQSILEQVMDKMNLQDFRERNYQTLSGGEKQRVHFARVLAQVWEKPSQGSRYLFLDEPLNNLDIHYQQEFMKIASGFRSDDTVLVAIVHDINLAMQFADRLFFLKEGKLIIEGTPEAIIQPSLIEEVFNIRCSLLPHPHTNKPIIIF
jgi:iron complex transport system ATP-binding protein